MTGMLVSFLIELCIDELQKRLDWLLEETDKMKDETDSDYSREP